MANKDNLTPEALQSNLADLKAQILELSESLASKAADAADRAAPAVDATRDTFKDLARTARHQGQNAAEVIRANPGTTTSVALTAGLLGMAIGYLIGSTQSGSASRWRM